MNLIFDKYDVEKYGNLIFGDFKKYLDETNGTGEPLADKDAKKVFDEIDKNKDGKINKDEFLKYFQNKKEQ